MRTFRTPGNYVTTKILIPLPLCFYSSATVFSLFSCTTLIRFFKFLVLCSFPPQPPKKNSSDLWAPSVVENFPAGRFVYIYQGCRVCTPS
jgi:hypothetical protein